jgi:hypothetical protein
MIKPVRNSSKLQSEELLWDMMNREIRGRGGHLMTKNEEAK